MIAVAEQAAGSDQGTALVVDDELSNRVVLKALLKRQGYRVVEAVDGHGAVERFTSDHPDLVFMDVMMPGMDGYEAAGRIKELAGEHFVPIIFLTALTDEEALVRCIEVGGDDFLTKPFSHTILRSKIRAFERIRTLNREVNTLYDRMRQEEEIAEEVFSGAVLKGNVALDVIRTRLQPAAIFSGDLLLTSRAPSDDLHVLLGDFTGHGLSAALGALPTAEVFRTMTAKGFAPEQILTAINRKLHGLLPTGMFLAAQFVRVSKELDHILVANCGLPEGLLIDGRSGGIRERVASAGLPMGIVPDTDFGDVFRRIPIRRGDRMLLASDGVTEALDPEGQLFGQARFEAAIADGAGAPFSMDAINRALDAFCGDAPQADDISLVEIPCDSGLFVEEYAEAADFGPGSGELAAAGEDKGDGEDAWEVSLVANGRRLARVDPVPLVINQIREMEGTAFDHSPLFTVLTELYVNALDHGVLRLDSSLKSDPEGFAVYFSERQRRLDGLRDGQVRFAVRREPAPGGWQLRIQLEDSGPGFDHRPHFEKTDQDTLLHGRGIRLVRGLCSSLKYLGAGNVVEAVFTAGKS